MSGALPAPLCGHQCCAAESRFPCPLPPNCTLQRLPVAGGSGCPRLPSCSPAAAVSACGPGRLPQPRWRRPASVYQSDRWPLGSPCSSRGACVRHLCTHGSVPFKLHLFLPLLLLGSGCVLPSLGPQYSQHVNHSPSAGGHLGGHLSQPAHVGVVPWWPARFPGEGQSPQPVCRGPGACCDKEGVSCTSPAGSC